MATGKGEEKHPDSGTFWGYSPFRCGSFSGVLGWIAVYPHMGAATIPVCHAAGTSAFKTTFF
jgi:hypothetical protein